MNTYYAASTGGFYDDELHGKNIPSDAVIITVETYKNLLNELSNGKQIVSNENGYPVAIIPPVVPPTWEQIKARRDALLKETDWIDLPNSPSKNKEAWLTYRQALRDLPQSFSTPEEVVWPEKP